MASDSNQPYDRMDFPAVSRCALICAALFAFSMIAQGLMLVPDGFSPHLILVYHLMLLMLSICLLLGWSEYCIFCTVRTDRKNTQNQIEKEKQSADQRDFLPALPVIEAEILSSESSKMNNQMVLDLSSDLDSAAELPDILQDQNE